MFLTLWSHISLTTWFLFLRAVLDSVACKMLAAGKSKTKCTPPFSSGAGRCALLRGDSLARMEQRQPWALSMQGHGRGRGGRMVAVESVQT